MVGWLIYLLVSRVGAIKHQIIRTISPVCQFLLSFIRGMFVERAMAGRAVRCRLGLVSGDNILIIKIINDNSCLAVSKTNSNNITLHKPLPP